MSSTSSLGKLLREFAERLGPDDEEVDAIEQIIDEVEIIVNGVVQENLDRIATLGSYARKTALAGEMDLDVVLYYDREDDPPYADILRRLEIYLKKSKDANNVTLKEHSLALNYKGRKLDILTAQNMLRLTPIFSSSLEENYVKTLSCVQHALTLQKIKGRIGKRRPIVSGRAWTISKIFSTSLSEAAEVFSKEMSSFGHSLAKLAKYWNKSIMIGTYFSGRSSIIEYIAFHIAKEEEQSHQDLYRAFIKFLKCVIQPGNILIFWTMFYREEDIPPYNKTPPCILDPTNPYNNLIYDKQLDLLKEIGSCAHVTLKRLKKYENWNRVLPFDPLGTFRIFCPQLTEGLKKSFSEKPSVHQRPFLKEITNTTNSSTESTELYHSGQKRRVTQIDSKPRKSRRLTSQETSRIRSAVDYDLMALVFGEDSADRFKENEGDIPSSCGGRSLDEYLMMAVEHLTLSEEKCAKVNNVARKIKDVVKQAKIGKKNIARVKVTGSYAKGTQLSLLPFIEMVVFLDCEGSPPYISYLKELQKVLKEHDFDVEIHDWYLLINTEGHTVRLETGKNFSHSGNDISINQLKSVVSYIKKKGKLSQQEAELFNSSTSEAEILFFNQRDLFSKKLTILAKLWLFHCILDITEYFEMEVLIELLCVWVTDKFQEDDKKISKAFERFLLTVKELRSVDIWWEDFYYLRKVSDIADVPRVLDPTNPYNNLLEGKDSNFFLTMRTTASETLKRLDEVKRYRSEHNYVAFFYLFSPA